MRKKPRKRGEQSQDTQKEITGVPPAEMHRNTLDPVRAGEFLQHVRDWQIEQDAKAAAARKSLKTVTAKPSFDREDLLAMLQAVKHLLAGGSPIFDRHSSEPAADSQAARERKEFPQSSLIKDVHARGLQSVETAADHLWAFHDALSEPACTIAPWTIVRGLLESCAIAAWFLDPQIDARTRVGRCFAFRYKGFDEQIKFFRADKAPEQMKQVDARMNTVEQTALSLGYPRVLDREGNRIGIGVIMPSIVDLMSSTLGYEAEYRLLSAVAHGHHWATSQVGYQMSETRDLVDGDLKFMEKSLHAETALYAAVTAVTSFSWATWCLAKLYGWELREMEQLLDETYTQLHLNTNLRFWRLAGRRGGIRPTDFGRHKL